MHAASPGTAVGAPAPTAPAVGALKRREKFAYGAGDLASNLSWNLVGSFLLYYYTDIAGVPIALLGTLFLVARLLDAVIDPLIGIVVDRTNSRWGKARPYLLFTAVPFGIIGVLTFSVPDIGDTGKLIYAFLTYLTLGVLFSLLNVPYAALLPMMTRDSNERMQMGGLRAIGSAVGTIIVTAGTTPFVAWLGAGNAQTGWTRATIIYGVLSVAFFMVTFAWCKERYTQPVESVPLNLRASLATLRKNRPWVVTFIWGLLNFTRLGLVLAVTVYFALEVLHAPWTISVLLPLVSGTLLIGGLVSARYYRAFGKRRGNLLALLVGGVAWLGLIPAQHNMIAFFIVYSLSSIAIGISMTSMFTMVAETVEYQQWLVGTRDEGLLSAGVSFAVKVGSAVGSAVVAFVLGAAGYSPGHSNAATTSAIAWLYFGAPVLLIVLQAITISFYDLDDKHEQLARDLDARADASHIENGPATGKQ